MNAGSILLGKLFCTIASPVPDAKTKRKFAVYHSPQVPEQSTTEFLSQFASNTVAGTAQPML
ncbi:MAG: hypothetical protein RLZZ458_319 [Planctomycetota bacterium]